MNELSQLLDQLNRSDNQLVYCSRPFTRHASLPLFVSLIGPSGAGKDTIKRKLLQTGKFFTVRTATNRARRKDEAETEYYWMRERHVGEPEQAYLRSLIKEHELFEYDYHYGSMYGTPVKALKAAFSSGKIPLYCSENQGALFMEKTLSDVADCLTIMIVPDSVEDMEKRILSGSRNNPTKRLTESLAKMAEAPQVAHFVIVNPAHSVEQGKSGLESAVKAVKETIYANA
jgi:guanylate kinase